MAQLNRAIKSQPAELERLVGLDLTPLAERLTSRQRIWLVGTGSSQHAAELGAMLLTEAGIDARWSGSSEFVRLVSTPGPDDAVVVISHTARTSFALAARAAARASGAAVVSITGVGGGWPEAIETVEMEKSHTHTVSLTATLMVLLRLADALGADGLSSNDLQTAVERVRTLVEQADLAAPELPDRDRAFVLAGAGAGAISAREGALKLREAARVLAEGYGGEYLLHGFAVPLEQGDAMLLIDPAADPDGLLSALGRAAAAEGVTVSSIDEPSIGHPILAQIPIIVQLQLLALAASRIRSTNPDKVIAGHWADQAMWAIGRPG